jgi:hypothetical protein
MALPGAPSAADLVAYLENASNITLYFLPGWYAGMDGWGPEERADVLNAASHNRSITDLTVDVAQLSPALAEGLVSRILSWLGYVRTVTILSSAGVCDPPVVDALLDTILDMKERQESAITTLHLYACSSPSAFLDFYKRFPRLEELGIGRQCSCPASPCSNYDDFMWTVAKSMRHLPTLDFLHLQCGALSIPPLRVMHALKDSSSVMTLELRIANASKAFLREVAVFCGGHSTVDALSVKGEDEFLDISPLFIAPVPGFSFDPSILEIQFYKCELESEYLEGAATTLEHVERIGFGRCRFSAGFDLVRRLPRLKEIFVICRSRAADDDESLADEFHGIPYMLETSEDLVQLCRVIERKESLIRVVELDLVCREPSTEDGQRQSFPAIGRLLRKCTGTLTVNFGNQPSQVCGLIASGIERLRDDLRELRLRFFRCALADEHYADILFALAQNKKLTTFELEFDPDASLGIPEASIEVISNLVTTSIPLQSLTLRGLADVAAFRVLELVMPNLATNRSLRTLDLGDADLTDRGPEIRALLLALLQTNDAFSHLDGFEIPKDESPEWSRVAYLLKQNSYGRRFLQQNPDLAPVGIWPTIFANLSKDKEHQVMYSFLRARPNLVRLPRRGMVRAAPR